MKISQNSLFVVYVPLFINNAQLLNMNDAFKPIFIDMIKTKLLL